MKWMKSPKQKITFESFLCGTLARDYIHQDILYDQQIRDAAEWWNLKFHFRFAQLYFT